MKRSAHARCGRAAAAPLITLLALCGACASESAEPTVTLTRQQLLDPLTCKRCHSAHYDEWSGSMHAYAAEDPVFLAMNRRGQEETGGKLGDFCVKCHAPMAVLEGATSDGLNLDEVPRELKGVTCYFCHNVESVEGTHNNPLTLSNDVTMRGGIADPIATPAHLTAYSKLLDSKELESSSACGACHDIVTSQHFAPREVHLERSFAEWRDSIFNLEGEKGQRCGTCHMQPVSDTPVADFAGAPLRRRHMHDFPGVDVALTEFPNIELQKQAISHLLDTRTVRVEVCVGRFIPQIRVVLDNVGVGHHFPSGAAQDRRAWVEVIATAEGRAEPIVQSGAVLEGEDITAQESAGAWVFRDRTFKTDGSPAHMFWDVDRVESQLIPAPVTLDQSDPRVAIGHASRLYPLFGFLPARPDSVKVRVRLIPIGLDVIDDLIQSQHLSPEFRDKLPVFTISPKRRGAPPWSPELTIEWTREIAAHPEYGFQDAVDGRPADCVWTSPGRQVF